jgi:hypothetical protein
MAIARSDFLNSRVANKTAADSRLARNALVDPLGA